MYNIIHDMGDFKIPEQIEVPGATVFIISRSYLKPYKNFRNNQQQVALQNLSLQINKTNMCIHNYCLNS